MKHKGKPLRSLSHLQQLVRLIHAQVCVYPLGAVRLDRRESGNRTRVWNRTTDSKPFGRGRLGPDPRYDCSEKAISDKLEIDPS